METLKPKPRECVETFGEDDLATKIHAVLAYESQARWIFREYGEPAECLRSLAQARSPAPGMLAERVWWLAPMGRS